MLKNVIGYDPNSHRISAMQQNIEPLLMKRLAIKVRPYDHASGRPKQPLTVTPTDVLILEGVHAFHPSVIPMSRLRYFIYADLAKARELKFIADFMERSYDIQTAFAHAHVEHDAFIKHLLPFLRVADHVVSVNEYWKYDGPIPADDAQIATLA